MKTFRKLRQKRAGSQVRPPLSRRQVLAGLMAGIAAGPAWAGPQGMTVQAGTVSAARTGANLDITASHNAVINWASFNIGAGETTTFHQPSAVSVVWNRILDANPSQIWGSLNGNGIVVLMNQNGFYFGPGSSVNVGGFIALAAPIAPASPAGGGLWQYQGPPPAATIINYGEVRAKSGGSLFMVAEHIENHGVLAAPGGTVGLYAGKEVLLSERPDGRGLSMNVQLPHGSVDNTGQVIADAGTIAVHARVVNQQGLVQANSVREANGTIELIATDQINLGANCVLEAKGDAQGISAGGQITLKSSGGFADAPGSSINVSGGAQGGNGGAVELSALSFSKINSRIEGSALPGWQGGQLLLDPYDITLSGADDTDSTPSQTVNFSDAPGLSLRLNVNSAFYGFSQITLQATHDILFESGTVWDLNGSTGIGDPGSLLRLEAGNNIVFGDNSRVVAGTGWSVHLAAGVDFSSPSLALRPGIGGIYLNGLTGGSGAIEAFDGEIQLRAGHEVLVGAGFIRTWGGGNIAITTLDGDVDAGTKNDGYQFGRTGPVTVGLDPDTRQPSYTWIGGIGTALGGDVSILAGRDILASSAPIGAFGIGNVNATAGRDILGQFILRKGVGTLHAGRDVGTELSGVSLALSQGGWQVTAGWDPGTGQAVAGRGDLFLDEIYNVNGSLNPNRLLTGARRAFQFDYGQDAFASLTAGNSVQLLGDSIAHAAGNSDRQVIYPPCLSIEAGPGGVVLGNDVILYPSPLGSLSIKTTGGRFAAQSRRGIRSVHPFRQRQSGLRNVCRTARGRSFALEQRRQGRHARHQRQSGECRPAKSPFGRHHRAWQRGQLFPRSAESVGGRHHQASH